MAADREMAALQHPIHSNEQKVLLQKFRLYETRSKFYLVGRDKSRKYWKVLKIDRSEPSELNIREDPATYSENECLDLLKRIHDGNRSTGGLKLVTKCYGIVGFVKFLGPYYMLLITRRRKIGTICGHTIYAVSKSEMITLPNSTVLSNMRCSKDENRYKKLLLTVDLTKDFFYSYSYNIMCSLQKNLCDGGTGPTIYETMFVWNEFLSRAIWNHLKNSTWTVALVYGFFKQVKLSVSGKDFRLTLIARRSRHYAGTRYLKRGVNEKGRVANDVETEQIISQDTLEETPTEITSVVQNRGSIPLFWSQETSRLNIRPDIILHKKDYNFEATLLHFENLVKRYGNPIIILNLIKSSEKKPRESLLRAEFSNAIDYINKDLTEENRLRFLHWDIKKHTQRKDSNVLTLMGKVAAYALNLTGLFYCQLTPVMKIQDAQPILMRDKSREWSCSNHQSSSDPISLSGNSSPRDEQNAVPFQNYYYASINEQSDYSSTKAPHLQKGVLRTNCIDCLDRTNVAQFAYGLAALGHQLYALGFISTPKVHLDDPLADHLMVFYERMGDTLALQYGGSAAHNKIFCDRRGQWKAATQSQELLRTLQRYYSNAYVDAEKQDAINIFLGYFQPQQGKPGLWELGSDKHYNIRRHGVTRDGENSRSFIKRSLSDGNILCESNMPGSEYDVRSNKLLTASLHPEIQDSDIKGHSDSAPEISTAENETSRFADTGHVCLSENCFDATNYSNFVDFDLLSSSENSCEEGNYERSSLADSPTNNLSTENVVSSVIDQTTSTSSREYPMAKEIENTSGCTADGGTTQSSGQGEFSDIFAHWVAHGGTLCY